MDGGAGARSTPSCQQREGSADEQPIEYKNCAQWASLLWAGAMSWEALAWAAKQRVTRAADKLVLIGLADRYNSEDEAAWPSLSWLADFTCLDRKTIINALDRLQTAGLIADSGVRRGRTGQIKGYALNLNSTENTIPKTEPLNSTVFPIKQYRKRNTEPIMEPIPSDNKLSSGNCARDDAPFEAQSHANPARPPKAKADGPATARPDDVDQRVWDDFLTLRRRLKAPVTETALTALRREGGRAGITLQRVLETCCANGWRGYKADWEKKRNGTGTDRPSGPMEAGRRIIERLGMERGDGAVDHWDD